ncbi:SDR family oxidoreductase [Myxococcota bacterium]|nr:SDR family oxidoreductase [Myxococcota bacterium]
MGVLSDRAVVITGAGRGLGRAYAEAAANEGARVVVNDIDAQAAEEVGAAIEAAGHVCSVHVGSVADWSSAQAMVEQCVGEFGRIDGLVNNAGDHYLTLPQEDEEDGIRQTVESNILGTMFPGIHAMRAMIDQGGGVIVNSTSAALCGMSMVASYGASKGAVTSLTYSWAIDLMKHGIRVNAISATALTRMVGHTLEHRDSPVTWPPEAMAPLVVYLLSDRSQGITGQAIRLWGGSLQLIGHPSVTPTLMDRESWTVEDLDAAFRGDLRDHLQPFGRDMAAYADSGMSAGPAQTPRDS